MANACACLRKACVYECARRGVKNLRRRGRDAYWGKSCPQQLRRVLDEPALCVVRGYSTEGVGKWPFDQVALHTSMRGHMDEASAKEVGPPLGGNNSDPTSADYASETARHTNALVT